MSEPIETRADVPDADIARRLASEADNGERDELVAYLTSVATFIDSTRGCVLVPAEPGDEILIRRTTHVGTVPRKNGGAS